MLRIRRSGPSPAVAWFVPNPPGPSPPAAQEPDPDCRDCKGTGEVLLLNRTVRCLCLDRAAPTKGGDEPAARGKPDGLGPIYELIRRKAADGADPPF
jgi:hypothetical protein